MEGTIANFRSARHHQYGNQVIVVAGLDKKKAEGAVGKKVIWKSPKGNSITGKVAGSHGNSGALRVVFEKGMPGQSIGTKVSIE